MVAGVPVIDNPGRVRVEWMVEVAPVFLGPIGNGNHLSVGPHGQDRLEFCIELIGQVCFLDSGARPSRTVSSRLASSS
jgi:hypothetical protein